MPANIPDRPKHRESRETNPAKNRFRPATVLQTSNKQQCAEHEPVL